MNRNMMLTDFGYMKSEANKFNAFENECNPVSFLIKINNQF